MHPDCCRALLLRFTRAATHGQGSVHAAPSRLCSWDRPGHLLGVSWGTRLSAGFGSCATPLLSARRPNSALPSLDCVCAGQAWSTPGLRSSPFTALYWVLTGRSQGRTKQRAWCIWRSAGFGSSAISLRCARRPTSAHTTRNGMPRLTSSSARAHAVTASCFASYVSTATAVRGFQNVRCKRTMY